MSDLFILDSIFTEDLSNTLFDFPSQGSLNSNGQITKIYGNEALENSVSLWLNSQKGERLRDPIGGGFLVPFLNKPVSEDNQVELQEAILTGFEQDFQPLLTLTNLSVTPNDDGNWSIKISAISKELKLSINVDEIIKVQE